MRAILSSWADIQVLDNRRWSEPSVYEQKGLALVAAAKNGHLPVVNILLAAHAHPDFRCCGTCDTPLHAAARGGHLGVLSTLIARGADLNTTGEVAELTPLHTAAGSGQADAVALLIEAGAGIEGTGNIAEAPLLSAACACSSKAMLTLLQHGANIGAKQNNTGLTPLDMACRQQRGGLEAAVDLLLRWGADETALNSDRRTPAKMLDSQRYTPRYCSQAEIDRVRVLLARAPADKAWRRRGWLVMLCSRASKVRSANSDESFETGNGGGGGGPNAAGDQHEDRDCYEATRNEYAEGVGPEVPGKANNSRSVAGIDAESEGWGRLVALLLGLELEGVFRTVAGFL